MSSWLIIPFVISLSVTFGEFRSRFLKCSFHICIRSSRQAAFSLAVEVLFLLLASFTVCHVNRDCVCVYVCVWEKIRPRKKWREAKIWMHLVTIIFLNWSKFYMLMNFNRIQTYYFWRQVWKAVRPEKTVSSDFYINHQQNSCITTDTMDRDHSMH